MVDLSSSIGADLWVCVPHPATDDFIQNMAAWFALNLPPGRKLYVEYSNEVGEERLGAEHVWRQWQSVNAKYARALGFCSY